MKIKNAYYAKSMPTKIVIEKDDGIFSANLTPFRHVEETELQRLAFFTAEMGDVIPDHTLRFYGLEKGKENAI